LFNKAEENWERSFLRQRPTLVIPYVQANPVEAISQDSSFLKFKSHVEQELASSRVEKNSGPNFFRREPEKFVRQASHLHTLLEEERA